MKKRVFYVFSEHADYIKECEKIGMKVAEDQPKDYPYIKRFIFGDTKYEVLFRSECLSGWEITVMALPEMPYSELLQLVQNSWFYDEIVGGIGIILKRHLDEFILFLGSETTNNKRIRKIKKLIKNEISERDPRVKDMKELLQLCGKTNAKR